MKTIGIDARLTFYRQGGIAEYMRQLVSALAQIDAPFDYKILHNYSTQESLPFKRVNCYTPCHHRLESWALGTELLPHRLDILHSPDFIPPRWGAKYFVITVHDLAFLMFPDIQTPESLRYYAGQIGRAVKQADHILAVSHATKGDLVNLLNVPPEKITVTWEGVHPQFRPLDQAEIDPVLNSYSLQKDDFILFVGTIEPRKNLPKLLEGYAIWKSERKNFPKLVLAGQGGWLFEPTFEAIRHFGLSDDVIWLENVPFSALPALYNGASLHVLPSLYEGFGFPPLEAMACGTPTIISDRGSLREVCGEAASYIDPDDAASIAAALEKLSSNSHLLAEMRQKGLDHARQFTWKTTAEQTLAVYKRLLRE